jgi:lysophospholipase L1-like esterase
MYQVEQIGRRYYLTTQVEQTIKELLPRNTDEVVVGGYIPVSDSGGVNFNSSSIGRQYFNNAHESRIRQNGDITKVKMYIPNTADWGNLTSYYFQVWRKDGATYDVIGEEDISASLVINQINTVTLSTPITVQEGDFIGIYIGGDVDDSCYGVAGYTTGLRYDSGSKVSTVNFDWDSKPVLAYVIPIEVFIQAPLIIGIGDSIMAGHTNHYSYIESTFTDDIPNQIMYQLAALDANFVYQNMGIGGQNSAQILARFSNDVVDKKPRYVVIMAGVNDLALGVLKATYLTNMTAILDLCSTNSIVPIIIKILPWSNGSNLQLQTRDDWMTDLQSLVATYSGAFWVDCDSEIGQFRIGGDPGNLWDIQTIYNDDGVHLLLNGYAKIAELIKDLLL